MGTALICTNCGKQVNSDEGFLDCPECNRPFTASATPIVVEVSTPIAESAPATTSAPKQQKK